MASTLKTMKKILVIILAALCLMAVSCKKETEQPVRLAVASDLHFIDPSLVEDYDFLTAVMQESDGKATHVTHLIIDAFIKDVLEQKFDAVVLSGDLTLNGEPESHLALAERLRPLLEAGIRVFVIPGNHDVNHTAYRFTSTGVEVIESTGPQFYEDAWLDYGYGDATYQDPMSDSYLTEITPGLWLLAIDSNTGSTGTVRSTTLKWMEQVLLEVREKGGRIVSTTHQNLIVHNERFTFGYVLNNASAVMQLLKDNGVLLNLSGHLHIQSIARSENLTEIDVSSLSVYPLQYGVLEVYTDRYEYKTRELPDEALKSEAKTTFDSCTYVKSNGAMKGIPEDEAKILMDNSVRLNREYFLGYISPTEQSVLDLYEKYPQFSFGKYLMSITQEFEDNRGIIIHLN